VINVNEELDVLYRCWSPRIGHLVPCGVVDEEAYSSGRPRLCFLLKEPNDPKQSLGWSMRQYLADQTKAFDAGTAKHWQFSVNLGMWSYAARHPNDSYADACQGKSISLGLKSLAMTNLKKSGGTGSSSLEEVMRVALETKDLWTQELTIMKPDLVVCGGTFNIAHQLLAPGRQAAIAPSGARFLDHEGIRYLDFSHPARIRIEKPMLFSYLRTALGDVAKR
jgi:hypothetical protein